jgi:hypothetical protein
VVIIDWGLVVVAGLTIRGREKGAGSDGLGLLLPFDANNKQQGEKISPRSLQSQREDSQQLPFSPFGRLRRRRREKTGWFGV